MSIPRIRTVTYGGTSHTVDLLGNLAKGGPKGAPGAWTVVFDDEFTGSTLDTSKWSTGWFGTGITGPVGASEPAYYDPARVTVSGGNLRINLIDSPQTVGGVSRRYGTGLVSTNGKFEFTYGALEARMYLPPGGDGKPVNWPSFWADGHNWPTTGELDVMEAIDGVTSSHFHSDAGGPGFNVSGSFGGWHTFGAVWASGIVTYFYDGVNVGSITLGITGAPMYLILGFGPAYTPANTVPNTTLLVDYVRVWQHP